MSYFYPTTFLSPNTLGQAYPGPSLTNSYYSAGSSPLAWQNPTLPTLQPTQPVYSTLISTPAVFQPALRPYGLLGRPRPLTNSQSLDLAQFQPIRFPVAPRIQPSQQQEQDSGKLAHPIAWLGGGLAAFIGLVALLRSQKATEHSLTEEPVQDKCTTQSNSSCLHQTSVVTPPKSTNPPPPIISVPAAFKDPLYCEQVAYKIADASFAETLAYVQNKQNDLLGPQLSKPLTKAVQQYLSPDCAVDLAFYITPFKPRYGGWTAKLADRPRSLLRIGKIGLEGNIPQTPEQIQDFYSTYCHEIRHLVYCFAEGPNFLPEKHLSKPGMPYHQEYKNLVIPYYYNQWSKVYTKLSKEYPGCQELDTLSVQGDKITLEQFKRFFQGLNQMWQKPGYPVIGDDERLGIWKQLFSQGDPKIVDYLVNQNVYQELEGYGTFMKCIPNRPVQFTNDKLVSAGHFLFLRDLLRLYYDERHIPQDLRHPYTTPEYAQAHPLRLFNEAASTH